MNTSKTKHTQGPWECDAIGYPVIINGPEEGASNVVAIVENSSMPHGEYQYGEDRARANANLIAAAPDLLAALQWALEYVEDDLCPDHQAALAAAHDAVKRATE